MGPTPLPPSVGEISLGVAVEAASRPSTSSTRSVPRASYAHPLLVTTSNAIQEVTSAPATPRQGFRGDEPSPRVARHLHDSALMRDAAHEVSPFNPAQPRVLGLGDLQLPHRPEGCKDVLESSERSPDWSYLMSTPPQTRLVDFGLVCSREPPAVTARIVSYGTQYETSKPQRYLDVVTRRPLTARNRRRSQQLSSVGDAVMVQTIQARPDDAFATLNPRLSRRHRLARPALPFPGPGAHDVQNVGAVGSKQPIDNLRYPQQARFHSLATFIPPIAAAATIDRTCTAARAVGTLQAKQARLLPPEPPPPLLKGVEFNFWGAKDTKYVDDYFIRDRARRERGEKLAWEEEAEAVVVDKF